MHLRVIFRTRVFVPHQDGDRRAERVAFENAGKNLAAIGFLALRDDLALARATPVEFALDVCFAQLNARRTTIDHDADAAAVGFAPGRNAKELSEAVAHRRHHVSAADEVKDSGIDRQA